MSSNSLRRLIGLSLVFVALATPTLAQPRTSTLRIVVVDPTGAVIVGASVAVQPLERESEPIRAVTNDRGEATLEMLPHGRYEITAEAAGICGEASRGASLARRRASGDEARSGEAGGRDHGRAGSPGAGHRPQGQRLRQPADARTDRCAARRSGRDGRNAETDGGSGCCRPRRWIPRREAAAKITDSWDPLPAGPVCG